MGLFIDYGHHANLELLANYGFTIRKNQEPIHFTTSELIEACQTAYRKTEHVCKLRVLTHKNNAEDKVTLSAKCVINITDQWTYHGHYNNMNETFFSKKKQLRNEELEFGFFV